jgi:hypothetical protein
MYNSTAIGGDIAIVTEGGSRRNKFLDPPLYNLETSLEAEKKSV